eukprot:m.26209 g.26209  ORF g.26209 m.26209 type:complete len:139 (+) comp9891_c0_seq1:188-604(+)
MSVRSMFRRSSSKKRTLPGNLRGSTQSLPSLFAGNNGANAASGGMAGVVGPSGSSSTAQVTLSLSGYDLAFENGAWQSTTLAQGQSSKEVAALKLKNQQLMEENNLLKYKLELLLDMVAVEKADLQALQQGQPVPART